MPDVVLQYSKIILLRHKDDEGVTSMLLSAESATNSTIDPMICSEVV